MILNKEFKPLSNYSQLIKQLEFKDMFDKYSICKNFYDLLDPKSQEDLCKDLGYEDNQREQVLDLLTEVSVIECRDDMIKLGSESAYIRFRPNEDKLEYFGKWQMNYKRKYC
jgi:hypothetical protein